MVTKTTECVSSIQLRKVAQELDAIESEIKAKILAAAKDLLDGGHINPLDFAGSFRVYEMVTDRFDSTINSYVTHQERHLCDIPDDLDELF